MIRASGILFIGICVGSLLWMHSLVTELPPHPITAGELLLALATIFCGTAGMALLCIGPALFRPYRWPPRNHEPGGDWWRP